jgi:hypothetical protein
MGKNLLFGNPVSNHKRKLVQICCSKYRTDVQQIWRTLRIAKVLQFIRRLEFYLLENVTFRKLDLFLSSHMWKETGTLLGPLE